jgi:hypothetical protein
MIKLLLKEIGSEEKLLTIEFLFLKMPEDTQ